MDDRRKELSDTPSSILYYTHPRGIGAYASVTWLPEHVASSFASPDPVHALASLVPGEVRRASECEFMWVDEHLEREVEIKVDDTVLVVCWEE